MRSVLCLCRRMHSFHRQYHRHASSLYSPRNPKIAYAQNDISNSSRYHSLLMRLCFKALDDHVARRRHVIHSPAKLKQSGLARWKMAVRRQKRSRRLDAVIDRHCKTLASKLLSSAFKSWSAAKLRNTRLSRVCARFLASKHAVRLRSFASVWRIHAKAQKSARQIGFRAYRRARRIWLRAAFIAWLQSCSLELISRHVRRRAAGKMKVAFIRMWEGFIWRGKHCTRVKSVVTAHESRMLQSEKRLCMMAWARLGALGRAQANKLSKADRMRRCNVKAAIYMTWNLESSDAKITRQRQLKSARAGEGEHKELKEERARLSV